MSTERRGGCELSARKKVLQSSRNDCVPANKPKLFVICNLYRYNSPKLPAKIESLSAIGESSERAWACSAVSFSLSAMSESK